MKGSPGSRLRRALWACLAAIGMALATTDGRGAEPRTMTFELVEGQGPNGLTRWIQASGPIRSRTEADFEAFAALHDLTGLTIALHSTGGVSGTSQRVGRRIRALKLNAIVGETFRPANAAEPQALLVTSRSLCGSACVNLLAGGVERRVQSTARVAVHQFAYLKDDDGNTIRSTWSDGTVIDDTNYAIELYLLSHAFLREMGINTQFMRLQASVAWRDLRTLTAREIEQVGLARSVRLDDLPEGRPLWFINRDPVDPGLLWRAARVSTPTLRIDDEMRIDCGGENAYLRYRVLPVRDGTGQSRRLTAMEIVLGGTTLQWSAAQGLAMGEDGLVLTRVVPVATLAEAASSGRLLISVTADGVDPAPRDLSDGFAAALAQLPASCHPPATPPATPVEAKSAPRGDGAEVAPSTGAR